MEEDKNKEVDKIITKIEELSKSKQWSRIEISNYTINDLIDLDNIIEELKTCSKETIEEVKKRCLELNPNQSSQSQEKNIVLLYILGFIGLNSEKIILNQHLVILLELFSDVYKKLNLAKHLANKILEYSEDKDALRVLSICYSAEGDHSKALEINKKIVEVDQTDPDIARRVAKSEEDLGNISTAILYYKKALYRFIQRKSFSNFKDILYKIMSIDIDDIDYINSIVKNNLDNFLNTADNIDKIVSIILDICKLNEDLSKWDNCILFSKKILEISSNAPSQKDSIYNYRMKLVEYYKNKYKNHSKLDVCIQRSDLEASFRDVFEAIKIFEKYIKFDVNSYVYHNTWGVGLITDTNEEELTIKFATKENHKMGFKIASSSLQPLKKNHFSVFEATKSRDNISKQIKESPQWFLKVFQTSFKNSDTKNMKKLLVPKYLTQGEWNKVLAEIKSLIKNGNNAVGNKKNTTSGSVTSSDYSNEFKLLKNFSDRMKKALSFFSESNSDPEQIKSILKSEVFNLEVITYFYSYLSNIDLYNDFDIDEFSALFFMEYIYGLDPDLQIKFKPRNNPSLKEILESLHSKNELKSLFSETKYSPLKIEILKQIRLNLDNWVDIYIELLPCYMQKPIINTLIESGNLDNLLDAFFGKYVNLYKEERDLFIWFFKTFKKEDWFPYENKIYLSNVVFNMIKLLSICSEDIKNKRNSILNKKIISNINSIFFKDSLIFDFIDKCNETECEKLYYTISLAPSIEHTNLDKIFTYIKKKYPSSDLKSQKGSSAKIYYQELDSNIFLTCSASFNAMRKEFDNITNIELPKNAKEIDEARQQGDLKENAEYKAARERQAMLSSTASKLKENIKNAKVIKRNEISIDYVGYGTVVELENLNDGKKEIYTILGPWESDTDKNIISYQAPLIKNLIGSKVSQDVKYKIESKEYNYKILSIKTTDLID